MKSLSTIIISPTNSIEKSLDFYQRLNYKILSKENPCLVSDGNFIIEINADRFTRAGIKLFKSDWSSEIAALEKLTTITPTETGYLLSDPNGVWIYLETKELKINQEIEGKSEGLTGNFAGMSIEAADMTKSAEIWQTLGFEKNHGSVEQGWIAYSNGSDIGLSLMRPLMCPHLFFNPSLTFFNGKNNMSLIEKIREAGIPIAEEITHFNKQGIVDNIIIRDPGGYGFFIFND
jgi:hypothetical protein